jgi:hypothetical protein
MSNKSDISIHDTLQFTIALPHYTVAKSVIPDESQHYYFYLSGCEWYIKACFDKAPNLLIQLVNEDTTTHRSGVWYVTVLSRSSDVKSLKLIERPLHHNRMKNYIENFQYYYNSQNNTISIMINIAIDKVKDTPHHNYSVLSDLKRHYDTISTTSDVYIITERTNSESILAHKAILTVRSPVFKAMFDSNMTESNTNQIQIPDFDAINIRRMVEFLYKDTFTDIDDTSYEDFVSLLAIANKYQVIGLKKAIESHVIKMLSGTNVSELTHNAILYDASDLLKACLHFL